MFFEKISLSGIQYSDLILPNCQCTCNHPNQPNGKSTDGAQAGKQNKTNNGTCSPQSA